MRRRGWGAAVLAVAAVSGTLIVQGAGGGDAEDSGGDGRSGPIRTSSTTAALTVADGGTSARLDRRDTAPFSMLGVTWAEASARVSGTIEVRTRDTASRTWSTWRRLDGDSGEGERGASRGGTTPAWVGPSDGVQVRMSSGASRRLPEGLRLDMIDPGGTTSAMEPAGFVMDPVDPTGGTDPTGTADATDPATTDAPADTASPDPSSTRTSGPSSGPTDSAEPTQTQTQPSTGSASPSPTVSAPDSASPTATVPPAPPSTAPRPPITSREGWGADESISPEEPGYLPGGKVKAVVLHHTATSNDYTCAEAPAIIRAVYAYDVQQLTWKDIGYNFLVDKCGTIYEGRKGGVDRPVMGAHAYGFNSETTGIAVIGDYSDIAPSKEAMTSVARLAAWKLGQYGVDPTGTTTLTAGASGPNYFRRTWDAGTRMTFPVIHGHRDGYNTVCPGDAYYAMLPTVRAWAGGTVEGLKLDSVTGTGVSGTTVLTDTAVTLKWSASTPAALVRQYDVLVDGEVAAAVAGTASSAEVNLAPGTHKVSVRGVHQSGRTAITEDVTVLAEPAPALTPPATTTPPTTSPTTPAATTSPTAKATTPAATTSPTAKATTPTPTASPTTKATTPADTTPPVFSTQPNLALRTGTVSTTAVPLTLKWKATDTKELKEVRLTAPVARTYGPTVTSASLTAKSGVATTWRMTAYDRAGNARSASVSGTPVILQESAATRTGTWTSKSSSGYLGGKSYGSSTKSSSLTWTFTGRSAALVVSRAATSGQVYVYADGRKTATVDLRTTTTKYRDAIWATTWTAAARHTVKLVVVGTGGRPTVTTDGLVYLK
ncbi:N-acetylmuramoyl-L-alanine amidase [Streptomyces sp. NBC_00151]|uniref:N-acetylmuramoyl-L-alanine amidase n=1 Tax=Streptomyces sp. NBC_00151 TaxID=2975669 RepID=UPI002DDA6DFD|nr:N-acetylmuramoyl-L-alanine amidase [Streptomyces sp. NBC_00151]WRZ41060.1 N-acetylmuramoyl-L-alanine amidase [Streptomyces sp. NBC_00151]